MVVVRCSVPNCPFATDDVTEALAIALLSNLAFAHSAPPAEPPQAPTLRGPKLERPKVDVGISIEEWNMFARRWEVFRSGSDIDDTSAPSQLFQCAGPDVGDSLLKANPNAALLKANPVAVCVLRTELLQFKEERDEAFRAFTARVRGKSETCVYTAQCDCGKEVDYTNHIIRDVLLNGVHDSNIRRELLGTPDVLTKPINEVVALAEAKEMASNAFSSPSVSATSFQRLKSQHTRPEATPPPADRNKEIPCPDCKTSFPIFTDGAHGWNTKPHQICTECHRARRRRRRKTQVPAANIQVLGSNPISQIASLEHHIFTKGGWRRAQRRDHPRASITISIDRLARPKGKAQSHGPGVEASVSAIADTGAQSDLWSLKSFSPVDSQPIGR